jgi:hypothetical protein
MELYGRMRLEPGDVEGLAVALYERLGFDPATPVDTFRLARKLLGPDAIERATGIVGVPAKVFFVRGERRIGVSKRLQVEHSRFVVGHELGHIVLDEIGYREDDIESVCDAFGAAVMAPAPAVRAMIAAFGRDHEVMADEICSTQTWAVLRVAEVLGIPRAVLTPRRIYARGPDGFVWGTEGELRRISRERVQRPGLRKTRLTDDPGRVVLDVDDAVVC